MRKFLFFLAVGVMLALCSIVCLADDGKLYEMNELPLPANEIVLQFLSGTTVLGTTGGGLVKLACDGTTTTCTYSGGKFTISSAGLSPGSGNTVQYANQSAGTILNGLASLVAPVSGGVVQATATTATSQAIGIVISGAGGTGTTSTIQTSGIALCTFDNSPTTSHYVVISPTTRGDCHDVATYPTSGQVIGRVSDGTGNVLLYPEVQSSTSAAQPQFAAYTFSVNGSNTVSARNNFTGVVDFTGTDAALVIREAIANLPCSTYYFKNPATGGSYQALSLVNNTAGSYNNWPAVLIPANAGTSNQYCKYTFIGESATSALHGTIQTQGTFLDITNTAIATAGGGTPWVGGFTAAADVGNSVGNQIEVDNLAVRLPDHTRGNTFHFLFWESDTVTMLNDVAYWAASWDSSTPVAGSSGNICMAGVRGSHDPAYFRGNVAFGCDIGFDMPGEHNIGDSNDAFENNYAGKIAFRDAPSYSGSSPNFAYGLNWRNFIDNWNIHGLQIGAGTIAATSFMDLSGMVIEIRTSGTYARTSDMLETNNGFSSGVITYSYAIAGTDGGGGTWPVSPGLFSSGGSRFVVINNNAIEPTFQPAYDNFPGPDVNNSLMTGGWQPLGTLGPCKVSSNAVNSVGAGCAAIWTAQSVTPDQFSKSAVITLDTNGAGVVVRGSTSVNTRYNYTLLTSGTPCRFLTKVVSGTVTILQQSNTCGVVGDSIELDVEGSTLIPIYTHSGVTTIDPNLPITTDTAITSGYPGVLLGGTGDSLGNWSGGSLLPKVVGAAASSGPGSVNAYVAQQMFNAGLNTKIYTVSTLPSASSVPIGTMLTVSDANSFTPGTCTGGGSDFMIAVSNGTAWSCH